jgi:nanoRNase/pAp phosphatase (c-di-AMP/oligoRNAs hydrolase)
LANQNLLRRIERPELPPAALDALGCALTNRRIIDKVAFVHLGRIQRDDLIPQIADFSLSFQGIEWAFVSGIYDSNYIISVRNVGYVRGAGRVLRDAFSDIGSAGGHGTMAKAIIPLSGFTQKWNIDPRNLTLVNEQVQVEFLRSLHSDK